MTALARAIDWIWTVRGTVAAPSGSSVDEAFARLDPLWRETGTTARREGDSLTFRKTDPASQDRLATFDRGRLCARPRTDGVDLAYTLVSRALAACFLLPAFFLGISYVVDGAQISGKVFAALFSVLYVVGRLLEPRLAAGLFRRHLGEGA